MFGKINLRIDHARVSSRYENQNHTSIEHITFDCPILSARLRWVSGSTEFNDTSAKKYTAEQTKHPWQPNECVSSQYRCEEEDH